MASIVPLTGDVGVNEVVPGVAKPGVQTDPAVTALADGRFLVVWEDIAAGVEIVARLFDANGTPIGAEFSVTSGAPGSQFDPAVAALPDGRVAGELDRQQQRRLGAYWVRRLDRDNACRVPRRPDPGCYF